MNVFEQMDLELKEAFRDKFDVGQHDIPADVLAKAQISAQKVGTIVRRRITRAQAVAQTVKPIVEQMLRDGCTWHDVGRWLEANPGLSVGLTTLREAVGGKWTVVPPKRSRKAHKRPHDASTP